MPSRRERRPSPPPIFAPAFARKRPRQDPYAFPEATDQKFKFAKAEEDPATVESPFAADDDPTGPAVRSRNVVQWGDSITSIRDVQDSFISPQEAMFHRPDGKKDPSSATTVISMIGGKVVSTLVRQVDDRARFRDENGMNYIDGIERGRMRKGLELGLQERLAERRQEIDEACGLWLEWQGLSLEEKEHRREEARKNEAVIKETLEIHEVEEVPVKYGPIPSAPASTSEKDEDSASITRSPKGRKLAPVTRLFSDTPSIASSGFVPLEEDDGETGSRYGYRESSPALFIAEDESPSGRQSPAAFSSTTVTVSTLGRWSSGDIAFLARDGRGSRFRESPRVEDDSSETSVSAFSQAQSHSRSYLGKRPRHHVRPQYSGPLSKTSGLRTSTPSIIFSDVATKFEFVSYPDLLPLEDIEQSIIKDRQLSPEQYEMLMNRLDDIDNICSIASCRGRLVSVSLTSEAMKYTSAAIVERCFGGIVQDIQFFPADRQAVLAFAFPKDAEAFIQHVDNAQKYSGHEYRRLQVAAEWYKGTAAQAIFAAQRNIIDHVVIKNISRVLHVKAIDKRVKLIDLLQQFKAAFEDKLIVNVKLVVPRKNYEREASMFSNSAVVEFSSIKAAFEAQILFERNEVQDFEGATATFLSDPIAAPRAKMPWCDCRLCAHDQSDEFNDNDLSSRSSYGPISSVDERCDFVTPRPSCKIDKRTSMRKAAIEKCRKQGYNAKSVAMRPDAYEERDASWKSSRVQQGNDKIG